MKFEALVKEMEGVSAVRMETPRNAGLKGRRKEVCAVRKYEITYILTPDFSEETVAAKVEQYQNQVVNEGGQVVNINNWGKRRFAYEVNGKAEGYYADELRRVMKNSDEVLRCMVVSVA